MGDDDGQYRKQMDLTAEERRAHAAEERRMREEIMAANTTPRAQRLAERNAGSRISSRPQRYRRTPSRGGGTPRGRGRRRAISPVPMQSLDNKFSGPDSEGPVEEMETDTASKATPRKRFQDSSPSRSMLIPTQSDPPNFSTVLPLQQPPPILEKPLAEAQSSQPVPRVAERTQVSHPLSNSSQILSQGAKEPKTSSAKEGTSPRPNNKASEMLASQIRTHAKTLSPPPASATAIAKPIARSLQERRLQQQPSKEAMERVKRITATLQPEEETVLDEGQAQEDEAVRAAQSADIHSSKPLPKKKRSTPTKERYAKRMRKLIEHQVDVDAPAVQAGVAATNRHTQSKRIEPASNSVGNDNTTNRRGAGSSGLNGALGPRNDRQKTLQRNTHSENGVINLVDDEAELHQKLSAMDVQTRIHPGLISRKANSALHSDTSERKEQAPTSTPKRSRQLRSNIDEQTLDSGVASPVRRNASVKTTPVTLPPLLSVPNMALSRKPDERTCNDTVEILTARKTSREIPRDRRHSAPPEQGGRRLAKAMETAHSRRDSLSGGQIEAKWVNRISVDLSDSEEAQVRARPGDLIEADIAEIMESLNDMNVTEFGIVALHYTGITDAILSKLCPVFEGICRINRVALCNNKIQNILDDFRSTMMKLRVVNFANNWISRVPNWLFSDCTSLVQIDLSGNDLRTIPAEIACMTQLEYLDLCRNQIKVLPRGLGQLRELRILDVKSNSLTQLPDDFGKENSSVILIDISDNPDFCTGFPSHCANFCETIQDLFFTGTAIHKELKRSQRKLPAHEQLKILIDWQGQNMPGDPQEC